VLKGKLPEMLSASENFLSVVTDFSASTDRVTATQISFVRNAPTGMNVIRKFRQPRRAAAVESTVALRGLPPVDARPESTARSRFVFVPKGHNGEQLLALQKWIAGPADPDATPTIIVQHNGETIRWRPGQALVQCTRERREEILAALVEFAFYEGELRGLEERLEAHEAQAQADVSIAYQIRSRDQKHWTRLRETIEYLARLRLSYARLEPFLAKASRTLSSHSQRLVSALFREADVEERLEALNDRLEVLEDLYEGANDRVADYRSYRQAAFLEIVITMLLFVETIIIAVDIYTRSR
jgi:hypothetical protein